MGTNGSIVWGGNQHETVPNPTVTPSEKKIADGKHPDEDLNNAARNAKTTKVYPPGNKPDGQHTDSEKVEEDLKRSAEMGKAQSEGGSGPSKSPLTPEEKKEREANSAEAVKNQLDGAKKAADAAVEKNPVPKEEKKALAQHKKEEKAEESISEIDE